MRASDADRERVTGVLRDHYGAGRLSDDELAARIDQAVTAKTTQELEALTVDLPGTRNDVAAVRPKRREPTRKGRALRAAFRAHLITYLAVNAGLIAIWAASGAGYFWPIWPIIGWGMGLGACYAPIAAGVGTRPARDRARVTHSEPRQIAEGAQDVSLRSAAAPDGTVTILFSDITGSTALNERLGDDRWLELLREHHRVVRGQIAAHEGFEVKVQGDGFMIAFPSARKAVRCALAIQRAVDHAFGEHPDGPVRVRIGLHTGDAIREEDDFYGRNVVLAARIAECAGAGEILASAVVKQLAESGADVRFEDEREVEFKGLGPQRVYVVSG